MCVFLGENYEGLKKNWLKCFSSMYKVEKISKKKGVIKKSKNSNKKKVMGYIFHNPMG